MDRVKLIPYSSKINLKIEQAFRDKNVKVVEFLSNDGNVHKVDLKRMHEYPAHNTADRVDVVRREKMAGKLFGCMVKELIKHPSEDHFFL